ncbi:MAG: LysR substrate-binding domain-containing protein [Betaproteobacteria bacterium]
MQKQLVLAGHGLTILPAIAVAEDVAQKRLTAAPVCDPRITRAIALALPANRVVRPPVRCVAELLVDCVKAAARDGTWLDARWLGS